MELFSRPLRFIGASLGLAYFSLIAFVYGAAALNPKPGLKGTLLKMMEDDELYLRFFNNTRVGHLVFRIFEPLFGFSYGEFVYVSFMLLVGTAAAWAFYRLCLSTLKLDAAQGRIHRPIQPFDEFIAAVLAVNWIFMSRKLINLCQFSPRGLVTPTAWIAGIKSLIIASGSQFSRFYQPGFSLLALVLGILILEESRDSITAKNLLIVLPILVGIDATLGQYPWVALVFLGYCGLQILLGWRLRSLLIVAIPTLLGLAGLILSHFGGKPDPELALRLFVERTHLPYWEFVLPELVLLGVSLFFRKQRVGRIAFFLLFAQLCASLSNVVTGYVVAPDHFFHSTSLAASLLIFAFVQYLLGSLTGVAYEQRAFKIAAGSAAMFAFIGLVQHLNWRKNYFSEITGAAGYIYWVITLSAVAWAGYSIFHNRLRKESRIRHMAWPLVVLAAVAGLGQQTVVFRRDYHMISEQGYAQTRRAQEECGRSGQPRYFFTTRVPQFWSIPARSICKNILYSSWDLDLKNEVIVARYMATMLYYKVFSSREELLRDLEIHLLNLASDTRQLSRNPYFYSDSDRFHYHLTWFLLFSGSDDPDRPSQMRKLFESVDLKEQLKEVEALDKAGQILVLETRRPDMDPPGRGM